MPSLMQDETPCGKLYEFSPGMQLRYTSVQREVSHGEQHLPSGVAILDHH